MADHKNLAEALAAFQSDIPHIAKSNTANAGTYRYDYADLTDVTRIVLPILGRHGLSFTTAPTLTDTGVFVLRYTLSHTSGDHVGGDYPLPDPVKTAPQQLGSAITYSRRYALTAVTGVAPGGDDDDAQSAQNATHASVAHETPPPAAPPEDWRALVAECATIRDLEDLYRLDAAEWFTPEVKAAFTARRDEIQGAA